MFDLLEPLRPAQPTPLYCTTSGHGRQPDDIRCRSCIQHPVSLSFITTPRQPQCFSHISQPDLTTARTAWTVVPNRSNRSKLVLHARRHIPENGPPMSCSAALDGPEPARQGVHPLWGATPPWQGSLSHQASLERRGIALTLSTCQDVNFDEFREGIHTTPVTSVAKFWTLPSY